LCYEKIPRMHQEISKQLMKLPPENPIRYPEIFGLGQPQSPCKSPVLVLMLVLLPMYVSWVDNL